MVKLPSCIQALDLQSLPCKVGIYMVRLGCGPMSLAPTSAAPQAACPPPLLWACEAQGLHSHRGSALCPGLLAAWTLCGLEAGCRTALSVQLSSVQGAAHLCRVGCRQSLLQDGAFLLYVRCEVCLQVATTLSLTHSLGEKKDQHLALGF